MGLETASVACCGTPAGSVSMDVDVLRCRNDVNTPASIFIIHRHEYSLISSFDLYKSITIIIIIIYYYCKTSDISRVVGRGRGKGNL